MYQQKYGHRPANNSRFSQNRFSKPRRSPARGSYINPSLFIKRAVEFTSIEDSQPQNNFEDFGLNEQLLKNIGDRGYLKPTPIQDQAIKPILDKRDILGIANTGTGKTAAFAIPLINQILENPNKKIIILAPTRELATQIKQDIRSLLNPGMRVFVALAIGGAYIREQIMDIRRGPHIIIGTPGRIMDLNRRRVIDFSQFDTVVLDEVDRMLDMGFVEDIKAIIAKTPSSRQTLFFSATVDRKIEILIDTFLNNPVKIYLKTQDSSDHVDQDVIRVGRGNNKEDVLCQILGKEECKKVLIFRSTKISTEKLTISLAQKGFKAGSIHGDKAQHQRQQVLRAFKEDMISILVATDVAARGLDIPNVTHVINFDKPQNYQDYIHRIGRTGRGNSKGNALTFID